MPTQKFTKEIITAAIEGFEAQKRRINEQIAELRGTMNGSRSEAAAGPETTKPKRKMSAAARRRIAAAQRKRWAEAKGQSGSPSPTSKAAKPKRKLSAAGRRNIIAATKKRWAAKRAAAAKAA